MTYAMTLDHSWEIMSEDEMHDVNGGWTAYRGAAAFAQISVISGSLYGSAMASNKLTTSFLQGLPLLQLVLELSLLLCLF
ncbi:MAG: hypothetical protein KMY54_03920 [Erysipelothrix sp.]|nr:hypothetical protein [Erysipelothrix sp.]